MIPKRPVVSLLIGTTSGQELRYNLGQKMCVNQFYPIQPGSFWSLQMLFISLPIMLYMVYVRNVSVHVRIVRVHIFRVTVLPITLNDTFESHKQEKINISRKLKKAHLEEKKTKAKKEIEAKKEQIQKDREELKSKKAAHEQLYEMPDGRRFNSGELTRILDQQEQVCPFFVY